jgi:hypothetical protein
VSRAPGRDPARPARGRESGRPLDGGVDDYERLASLIELELQLVSERRFDELQRVSRARVMLQDSLPGTPPQQARDALERCALLCKRVEIELLRVREALLLELAQVARAQRAAAGYAPARRAGRRVAARA